MRSAKGHKFQTAPIRVETDT